MKITGGKCPKCGDVKEIENTRDITSGKLFLTYAIDPSASEEYISQTKDSVYVNTTESFEWRCLKCYSVLEKVYEVEDETTEE